MKARTVLSLILLLAASYAVALLIDTLYERIGQVGSLL